MSVLEKMKNKELFTSTEQSVIEYMNNNIDRIIYMSIGELTIETYSSNSTIIRICRKLGVNGFKEFKTELTLEMQDKKHEKQTIDFTVPFTNKESIFEITNIISSLYIETINILSGKIKQSQIEEMVDTILNAHRLFIFCSGETKCNAKIFTNRLNKIGLFPIIAVGENEELVVCKNIKPNDCVMIISYRGNTPNVNNYLNAVKKQHCKIISITANENCLLNKYSHLSIVFPYKETDSKIATYYSQVVFHYIFDILYSVILSKKDNKKVF